VSSHPPATPRRGRGYLGNALANYLGFLASGLAVFVFTPLIVRALGTEQFGLYRIVVSVAGHAAILDLGMHAAAKRFLADAFTAGDHGRARRVMGASIAIYGTTAALSFTLLASGMAWLPPFLQLAPEVVPQFRWLVLGGAMRAACQLLANLFMAVCIARGRYDLLQFPRAGGRVAELAGITILVVLWRPDVVGVAVALLILSPTTILLGWWAARRAWSSLGLRSPKGGAALVRQMVGFSGYGFMMALGPIVLYQSLDLLMGRVLGASAVGLYAAPMIFVTYLLAVGGAAASPLFAVASEHAADTAALRRVYVHSTRLLFALVACVVVPLGFFGDRVLVAWMGEPFRAAWPALVALLVAHLFSVSQLPATHLLTAAGSIRGAGLSQILVSASALVLAIIFLARTELGLTGVGLAVAIPLTVRSLVFMPGFVCRRTETPLAPYLRGVYGRAGVVALGLAGVCWILRIRWSTVALPEVVAQLAIASVIGLALVWMLGLQAGDREWIRSAFRRAAS